MANRKIQRVTVTLDVEITGRPALPNRKAVAAGVINSLKGVKVTVPAGETRTITPEIIGVYSKLVDDSTPPELSELRSTPAV